MKSKHLSIFVGEKIKYYRQLNKMTQTQLAEKIGVAKTTISGYEKGYRSPMQSTLFKIADVFNISIDDLFPPIGDNVTTLNNTSTTIQEITDTSNKILHLDRKLKEPRRSEWISHGEKLLEEQIAEEHTLAESTVPYDVRARTELAAGIGYSYDDNDIKTVQVSNEPPRHDLASIVNGDSMLPDYENGDVVYLKDTGFSSYSGQVCAVVVNDKTYLKKVYTEDDCLRLVSLNPKYDDIIVDFPPSEDTHIKIYAVIGSDKVLDA